MPGPHPEDVAVRGLATCPEEAKPALVAELELLGARQLSPAFRAVAFDADLDLFYELHLRLRTASRLLRIVKSVPAQSAPMLYSQVRRIRWQDLFDARHAFKVECTGVDATAAGLTPKQVITQVREGIRAVFAAVGARVPPIDTDEAKVVVVAHLERGRCTLCFDTSGKALHKRGYRGTGHPAPLKETLAAAILHFGGYDGTQVLLDPMCGSGTIAIEAATMAVRKPPHMHRRKGEFHLEWLADFDRTRWRVIQERLRAEKLDEPPAPIHASDIDAGFVELARRSALAARVERYIRFATCPVQQIEAPAERGLIVTNLPYGGRIGGNETMTRDLYAQVGDTLKQRFAGWRAALFAAEASPWRAIGLKPERSVPLMNGNVPCRLLLFELYQGSRRGPRES